MSTTEKPIAVFTTKLGVARKVERSRIWIEGGRLIAAGFTPGRYFAKDYSPSGGLLTLSLLDDDSIVSTLPCKVSGKGTKPIIDITGDCVREYFAGFERVTVKYFAGRIEVSTVAPTA